MTDTEEKNMSFLSHLEELRWRLFRIAILVIIFAVCIFIFTEPLLDSLYISMSHSDFITYQFFCKTGDLLGLEDELCATEIKLNLQSITPTAQFSTQLLFSIVGGIIAAFPYIAWNIWHFVKPALKSNEQKASRGFVIYASLLFVLGILFGYYIIAPLCVQFFGNWSMSDEITNNFTITSYMSIITTTTFFTGLLFELPILVYILSKIGLLSPEFLRKYRKHAFVLVLILAAIITPPDLFSQIIVAIPIAILYEISIIVSNRVRKSSSK